MNKKQSFDPIAQSRSKVVQFEEHTGQAIRQWQRIVIYEQDLRTDDYYQVGTIYGKNREILGGQISKMMLQKWSILSFDCLEIDKSRFELRTPLSNWKVIIFSYHVPGNENSRSLGQGFGSFCRAIANYYRDFALEKHGTQAPKRISKHVFGSSSSSAMVAPYPSKIRLLIDKPRPMPTNKNQ